MKNTILSNIGLNKNEVLVYETLLSSGEMIVSEITEKTELGRQNTYAVLKSLVQKGLIEEFDKKKKLTYRVEPPSKLAEYSETKKREHDENLRELYSSMPALNSEYNLVMNKPGIKYFEGIEGFKRIYEDILKDKEDLYIFASEFDRTRKEINFFLNKHIEEQKKLGIKVRSLIPKEDYVNNKYIEGIKKQDIEVKVLPMEIFSLQAQILIYGDKVVLTSFKNKLISTWIQNKDIAQTFTTIF